MTLAALREGTLVYSHSIGDILPASDSCCIRYEATDRIPQCIAH